MKDEENRVDPDIEQEWMAEVDRRAKEGEVKMISQEKFEQMRREKKKTSHK